jgi:hypothetical protein
MTKFHLIKAAVLVAVVAVLLISVCRQVEIIFAPFKTLQFLPSDILVAEW